MSPYLLPLAKLVQLQQIGHAFLISVALQQWVLAQHIASICLARSSSEPSPQSQGPTGTQVSPIAPTPPSCAAPLYCLLRMARRFRCDLICPFHCPSNLVGSS